MTSDAEEQNKLKEDLFNVKKMVCDSLQEIADLVFENRSLRNKQEDTLRLGNKLAEESERILGLGLHQNTLPRFKAALADWTKANNMKEDYFVQTVPCVHIGNGEWIAVDKVEYIDISEDFEGYDLMTFVYKGKEMQSKIISRPA